MNEEAKLRAKYGGALPRQQNMLTKKLLNKVMNSTGAVDIGTGVFDVF